MNFQSSSSSDSDERSQGYVTIANELLLKVGLSPVLDLTDCTADTFTRLYEGILGDKLKGTILSPQTQEDDIHNVQCVIDSLAQDVLHCDLSHITGAAIVDGDTTNIQYLLEIMVGLMECIMEQIESEISSETTETEEFPDSLEDQEALTSGTVSAISEILRQEGLRSLPQDKHGNFVHPFRSYEILPSSISGDEEQRDIASDVTDDLILLGEEASSKREPPKRIPKQPSIEANNLRASVYQPPVSSLNNIQVGSRKAQTLPLGHKAQRLPAVVEGKLVGDRLAQSDQIEYRANKSPGSRRSRFPLSGFEQPERRPRDSSKKDLTVSTFSSASWPKEPVVTSSTHPPLPDEFNNLGTRPRGAEKEPQPEPSLFPWEDQPVINQQHIHTHHHYHKDAVAPTMKRQTASRSSTSLVVPPPSMSRPVASQSAPSSPSRGVITKERPERSFVTFTPPKRDVPHQSTRPTRDRSPHLRGHLGPSTTTTGPRVPQETDDHVPSTAIESHSPTRKPLHASNRGSTHSVQYTTDKGREPEKSRNGSKPCVMKSSSWDAADSAENRKIARKSLLARHTHPSTGISKDRTEKDARSQRSKAEIPVRSRRRVAFEDDQVDVPGPSGGIPNRDALLERLRKEGYILSSDDNNDEEVSFHSDTEVDYQRHSALPRQRSQKQYKFRSKVSRKPQSKRAGLVSGSVLLERSPPVKTSARVRFEDALDNQAKGRMGKIRRKLTSEKKAQDRGKKYLQYVYSSGLQDIQERVTEQTSRRKQEVKKQDARYKRKVFSKPQTCKYQPANKYESKTRPSSAARARPVGRTTSAKRKRSRSASPSFRRQRKLTINDDDVLPTLMSEFPFLHVSPTTAHTMWTKQLQHADRLAKAGIEHTRKNKVKMKVEEAEKRHDLVMEIMRKELNHNERMREIKEKRAKDVALRSKVKEQRQVNARARRYYDEFRLRAKARMVKSKTKEEQVFKNLFEDALTIQKSRIADLRKYARDKREEVARRQQDEIDSIENYYKDQFCLLAEAITKERQDLQIRDRAQSRVMEQMKREMRKKMESDIRGFQEQMYRDDDVTYFRELDADRMRQELRTASYKTQL